ncbi:MAG: VWA domain-containing protein [Cytophagaceae bacterium]|nr:VWA domain-containing protein [Cytophagaceae bacterium]
MKLAFLTLKSLLLALVLISCGGNDVNPENTFQIYLDFWNTTGKNPEVKFDEKNTSREIKIDFSKTFGGETQGSTLTKVIIDNFRIIDASNTNYNIESITAYEYKNDTKDWKKDVEFTMSFSQSEDISVVLVLDRSESLGADFETIKTYAIDFIEKIFTERKVVKMGIVDFADTINQYPLTTDKEALKNYVKGLKQGKFTALYQSIDAGIDMLMDSKSQSRVLFTFTDGTDNMAPPSVNADYLLNRIKNVKNSYKITSFFFGLNGNGGVDQAVLTKLASNGGSVSFPENVKELKEVFTKFGKVIFNVYNLEYIRNQQIISKADPRKLRFEIRTLK